MRRAAVAEPEESGFESWEALLRRLKPGRSLGPGVNPVGMRYRQGGEARDWAAPGGERYTPLGGFMQCGSARWSGAPALSGGLAVNLPAHYADTPLVWVTPAYTQPLFSEVRLLASPQASSLEIHWWAAAALTELHVFWLAFGPGAV